MRSSSAALLVVVVLAATGCSTGSKKEPADPQTFDVHGLLTLTSPTGVLFDGDACQGRNGYDDINAGAQVVIRNASGKSVGVGELDAGETTFDGKGCLFPFTVADVPAGSKIYSSEVAHRGEISFEEADAFELKLTLSQ